MAKEKEAYSISQFKKIKSAWVFPGKTDEWWQKMIGLDVPERLWKKIVQMSRDAFYDLVAELHPFIAPQGNCPNYRLLTTEKDSLLPYVT